MVITINTKYVKGILTKSNLPVSDFSANPYTGCAHACKYCYASFMKRFTHHYNEDWGTFIDVKIWPEIKNPSKYSGREIFIASVTDPYQPCEEKFMRTRALLSELKGSGARISIATKSDLILRDLDLIKSFPDSRVSFSINTLDEDFRSEMDCAASIERRLNAMKIFHEAGVRTTCFISPIFPGISDVKAIIMMAKDICNLIWLENLNLRGDYRVKILNWIHDNHPELDSLYHEIYSRKNFEYWFNLNDEIKALAEALNLPYVRNDDSMKRDFNASPVIVNYFFHEQITR